MSGMDGWDWLLFAIGSYLAFTTLVSLMRARRNVVLQEISSQAAGEKRRQEAEKKKKTK
jgi:hypothetical protein